MDLTTLLATSDRRSNGGFLLVVWVITGLTAVSYTFLYGWAYTQPWTLTQLVLFGVPSLMHLRGYRPEWLKHYFAWAMPLSLLTAGLYNSTPTVDWPLWFISLGVGAYYATPAVAIQSTIGAFAGLAATALLDPPVLLAGESLGQHLALGVLVMIAIAFFNISSALRQQRIMSSLNQAAALEQVTTELNGAMAQIAGGAAAVKEASAALTAQGAAATQAVDGQVVPGVALLRTGFQEQARSLGEMVQGSELLSSSIHQLASGATEQAEQVTDATARVQAVTLSVGELVSSVESVSQDARLSSQLAEEGSALVSRNQETAQRVDGLVREAAGRLADLGRRSDKIGEVVGLIQAIAGQTSLLALNAAIEAARAGEQGRGFAVVADEVRKLADRSAAATREIGNLLTEVQQGIESSLTAMAQTTQGVSESASQSGQAARKLMGIREATNRTAEQVQEFHSRIAEISQNALQISDRMSHLAALTEENTAASEEMADAARRVSNESTRARAVQAQGIAQIERVEAAVTEMRKVIHQLNATGSHLAGLAAELGVEQKR